MWNLVAIAVKEWTQDKAQSTVGSIRSLKNPGVLKINRFGQFENVPKYHDSDFFFREKWKKWNLLSNLKASHPRFKTCFWISCPVLLSNKFEKGSWVTKTCFFLTKSRPLTFYRVTIFVFKCWWYYQDMERCFIPKQWQQIGSCNESGLAGIKVHGRLSKRPEKWKP